MFAHGAWAIWSKDFNQPRKSSTQSTSSRQPPHSDILLYNILCWYLSPSWSHRCIGIANGEFDIINLQYICFLHFVCIIFATYTPIRPIVCTILLRAFHLIQVELDTSEYIRAEQTANTNWGPTDLAGWFYLSRNQYLVERMRQNKIGQNIARKLRMSCRSRPTWSPPAIRSNEPPMLWLPLQQATHQ